MNEMAYHNSPSTTKTIGKLESEGKSTDTTNLLDSIQ